jgi:hypothetical protein
MRLRFAAARPSPSTAAPSSTARSGSSAARARYDQGSQGNDNITGGAGADHLYGNGGADTSSIARSPTPRPPPATRSTISPAAS